jgi:hypothetical protein
MLRQLYCMLRRLYLFSMKLMASLAPAQAEDDAGVVGNANQNVFNPQPLPVLIHYYYHCRT